MDFALSSLQNRQEVDDRLLVLWESTGDEALFHLAEGRRPDGSPDPMTEQERSDWISTSLMNCFKNTAASEVFALLFELNRRSFQLAVQGRIRAAHCFVDPQDVLQEVFLNIYRYPNNFHADRSDSFRNWGHRIVRNTLIKHLKSESRGARPTNFEDEEVQWEDARTRTPYRAVQESESAVAVDWAYLIYLNLYLHQFRQLSPKEQKALSMVEVDGASYKTTADALGIRLENLKMVIFRGRKKIFRGLAQSLELLASGTALPGPVPRHTSTPTIPPTRLVSPHSSSHPFRKRSPAIASDAADTPS